MSSVNYSLNIKTYSVLPSVDCNDLQLVADEKKLKPKIKSNSSIFNRAWQATKKLYERIIKAIKTVFSKLLDFIKFGKKETQNQLPNDKVTSYTQEIAPSISIENPQQLLVNSLNESNAVTLTLEHHDIESIILLLILHITYLVTLITQQHDIEIVGPKLPSVANLGINQEFQQKDSNTLQNDNRITTVTEEIISNQAKTQVLFESASDSIDTTTTRLAEDLNLDTNNSNLVKKDLPNTDIVLKSDKVTEIDDGSVNSKNQVNKADPFNSSSATSLISPLLDLTPPKITISNSQTEDIKEASAITKSEEACSYIIFWPPKRLMFPEGKEAQNTNNSNLVKKDLPNADIVLKSDKVTEIDDGSVNSKNQVNKADPFNSSSATSLISPLLDLTPPKITISNSQTEDIKEASAITKAESLQKAEEAYSLMFSKGRIFSKIEVAQDPTTNGIDKLNILSAMFIEELEDELGKLTLEERKILNRIIQSPAPKLQHQTEKNFVTDSDGNLTIYSRNRLKEGIKFGAFDTADLFVMNTDFVFFTVDFTGSDITSKPIITWHGSAFYGKTSYVIKEDLTKFGYVTLLDHAIHIRTEVRHGSQLMIDNGMADFWHFLNKCNIKSSKLGVIPIFSGKDMKLAMALTLIKMIRDVKSGKMVDGEIDLLSNAHAHNLKQCYGDPRKIQETEKAYVIKKDNLKARQKLALVQYDEIFRKNLLQDDDNIYLTKLLNLVFCPEYHVPGFMVARLGEYAKHSVGTHVRHI